MGGILILLLLLYLFTNIEIDWGGIFTLFFVLFAVLFLLMIL